MVLQIILFTIVLETLTIMARFFFGPMKERHKKMKFKYKVRVHHGYIGLALILAYLLAPLQQFLMIGSVLLFSDFIHHFMVLPLLVKRTEFP